MSKDEERQALINREFWLKYLLDYHVQNRGRTSMTDKEFEAYVDAALDEIIEIRKRLTELDEEES